MRRRLAEAVAEVARFDHFAEQGVELRDWGRPVVRDVLVGRVAALEAELDRLGSR